MILERERAINEADKERIRANLLRAISHDLRTPLTSIIGSSDSFIENYQNLTDPEKQSLVSSINEDSHWLLNMVENLLSVTRIQDDTGTVKKEDEVVEEVVSEAIIRLKRRLPDIEIHVSAPEDVLIIPMDPLLIEQVLMNLMENAFVHSESDRPIDLRITENPDTVTFHIIDYGKGIDEQTIPLILKANIQPHVHRIPTVAWESVFLSATLLSRHMAEKLPHIIMQMALNFYLHYQRRILNHE